MHIYMLRSLSLSLRDLGQQPVYILSFLIVFFEVSLRRR